MIKSSYLKKITLHCNNFVRSVDEVAIKLKTVKLFTWNSEYLKLKLSCIQLNGSIVYDIMILFNIYIYIYIYIYDINV